jgi:hypothetical protein
MVDHKILGLAFLQKLKITPVNWIVPLQGNHLLIQHNESNGPATWNVSGMYCNLLSYDTTFEVVLRNTFCLSRSPSNIKMHINKMYFKHC